MEYDNLFDSLTFDEKLLNEKLGYAFSDGDISMNSNNMNDRVRRKMIEDQILREEIRREIRNEKNNKRENNKQENRNENFIGGLEQERTDTQMDLPVRKKSKIMEQFNNKSDGEEENFILNNKTLLILVFVLAAICIVQYIHQQSLTNSLNELIKTLCVKIKDGSDKPDT